MFVLLNVTFFYISIAIAYLVALALHSLSFKSYNEQYAANGLNNDYNGTVTNNTLLKHC